MAIQTIRGSDDPFGLLEAIVFYNALVLTGVKKILNIFHFKRTAGSGAPSMPDLVNNICNPGLSGPGAYYSVNLPSDDSINLNCTLRFPLDPTDAGEEFLNQAAMTAGPAGDTLPLTQCVTVNMASGFRGRSYRGAKRFGPVAESDTTLDSLNTTGSGPDRWGNIGNLIGAINDAHGSVYGPVILSARLSNLVGPTVADTSAVVTDIVSASLNIKLGTMRHRKVK